MECPRAIDVKKCCRICLKVQPQMRFLSNPELIGGQLLTLAQVLNCCTSIQLTLNDSLPNMICKTCIDRLYLSWNLKTDCEKSESKLKQFCNINRNISPLPTTSAETTKTTKTNTAPDSTENAVQLLQVFAIKNKANVPDDQFVEEATKIISDNLDKILDTSTKTNISNNATTSTAELNNSQKVVPETQKPNIIIIQQNTPSKAIDQPPKDNEQQTNRIDIQLVKQENNSEVNNVNKDANLIVDLTLSDDEDKENNPNNASTSKDKDNDDENNNNSKKQKLNPKTYLCTLCEKTFETKEILDTHIRTHISSTWTCKVCFAQFDKFVNLELHLKNHVDKNTKKCSRCSKNFNSEEALKNHEKLHDVGHFK